MRPMLQHRSFCCGFIFSSLSILFILHHVSVLFVFVYIVQRNAPPKVSHKVAGREHGQLCRKSQTASAWIIPLPCDCSVLRQTSNNKTQAKSIQNNNLRPLNPSNVNNQADLCEERCIKSAVRMTNRDTGIKRSLAHKGFTESNYKSADLCQGCLGNRECRTGCVSSVYTWEYRMKERQ